MEATCKRYEAFTTHSYCYTGRFIRKSEKKQKKQG